MSPGHEHTSKPPDAPARRPGHRPAPQKAAGTTHPNTNNDAEQGAEKGQEVKDVNIGNLKLAIPDYKHSNVGKAIELVQNSYESGELKALVVFWATKDGVSRAIVGDHMILPIVLMTASAVSGAALDGIESSILGEDDED